MPCYISASLQVYSIRRPAAVFLHRLNSEIFSNQKFLLCFTEFNLFKSGFIGSLTPESNAAGLDETNVGRRSCRLLCRLLLRIVEPGVISGRGGSRGGIKGAADCRVQWRISLPRFPSQIRIASLLRRTPESAGTNH